MFMELQGAYPRVLGSAWEAMVTLEAGSGFSTGFCAVGMSTSTIIG